MDSARILAISVAEKFKELYHCGHASRIFYFLPFGKTFVLLHGFMKKSEETPKSELETAYRYMEDFRRRFL